MKEELNMPFTEICIYQVKPQKVEEFEALMLEAKRKKTTEQHKKIFTTAIGSLLKNV